jgi:hypothetical protein
MWWKWRTEEGAREAKSAASGSIVERSGARWSLRASWRSEQLGEEEETCVCYF